MRVVVENLYTDKAQIYEGTPESVAQDLMLDYPWIRSDSPEENNIVALVDHLDHEQSLTCEILDDVGLNKAETAGNLNGQKVRSDSSIVHDMMGHNQKLADAFQGARFLSSRTAPVLEHVRRALWDHDGDPWKAALAAHGLEVSPSNLKALHAVLGLSSGLQKNEEEAVHAQTVWGVLPEGTQTANVVRRSFQDRFVVPVKLNGRHTDGVLLARDEETNITFLLKPGSGGQSPALGVKEESASQSRREACFYYVADAIGLNKSFAKTDLLLIDGKEYAAIRLLPWSYKTMDWKQDHGVQPSHILGPHLAEGMLHRWALIDYVLGNPDRHANNIMVGENREVVLIDHGSSFAGKDFDPVNDRNSFIPFYLRGWVSSSVNFNKLPNDEKLQLLPRLNESKANELRAWIDGLNTDALGSILVRYGIDPEPFKVRLIKAKTLAQENPADLAINRLWTDT